MLLIEIVLVLALVAWQAYGVLAQPPAYGPGAGHVPASGRGGRAAHPYTAANPEKNFAVQYDALITRDASPEFGQIIADTNEYLQNNRGAAADFGILKEFRSATLRPWTRRFRPRLPRRCTWACWARSRGLYWA